MPRSRRLPAPPSDTDSDSGGGVGDNRGAAPVQRNAANARERARMRVLSRAFCRLKTTLPWVPADTKLSKLDTLRLATSYIAHLRAVLTDEPPGHEARRFLHHRHPLTLTWPFNFHKTDSIPSSDTCMDQDQDQGDGEWCIQHSLPHVTALDSSREKTDVSYYY